MIFYFHIYYLMYAFILKVGRGMSSIKDRPQTTHAFCCLPLRIRILKAAFCLFVLCKVRFSILPAKLFRSFALLGTSVQLLIHVIILSANHMAAEHGMQSWRFTQAASRNIHINHQNGDKYHLRHFDRGVIKTRFKYFYSINADLLGFSHTTV